MTNRTRLLRGHRDPWSPHVLSRSVLNALWHSDNHGTALMTDDGAGLISSWKDLINLTNPTAATTARPTWSATSFDGTRSAVTFDGVANAMATTTFPALPVTTAPGWMFMVGSDDSDSTAITILTAAGYGASTTSNGRYLRRGGSALTGNIGTFIGGTGTLPDWGAAGPIGTRFMAFAQFLPDAGTPANGAVDGRFNGSSASSYTRTGTISTSTTRLRLGASIGAGASAFWQGKLRVVAIGSGNLPLADRQRLEGFYAADSGLQSLLPAEHPYRYAAP